MLFQISKNDTEVLRFTFQINMIAPIGTVPIQNNHPTALELVESIILLKCGENFDMPAASMAKPAEIMSAKTVKMLVETLVMLIPALIICPYTFHITVIICPYTIHITVKY